MGQGDDGAIHFCLLKLFRPSHIRLGKIITLVVYLPYLLNLLRSSSTDVPDYQFVALSG